MSDTIISNLIINEMTEAEKSTTTFGANQLIMTPDDTITSEIIDLGSYQYTYEGYVLPAIDVDVLRTIYANDKAGIYQTLVWSIYGNDNQFKVVCSDEISGTYSIDILVHNKYHCAYEWTSATTGNVNPTINEKQLELDSHTTETSIELSYNKYTKITAQNGALTVTLKTLTNYVPQYQAKITTVASSAVTFPSGTAIYTNDTTNCVIVSNVATLATTKTYEINIQDGVAYIFVL